MKLVCNRNVIAHWHTGLVVCCLALGCGSRTGLETPGGGGGGCVTLAGGKDHGGRSPVSCVGAGLGLLDCGADKESCCTSLVVPGGTFFRTYLNSGTGATGTRDPAAVSSFRLDKYLVTVGRFRQFVRAWDGGSGLTGGAGYEPSAGSGKHAYLNGGRGLASGPNIDAQQVFEAGWIEAQDAEIAPTTSNLSCAGTDVDTWTDAAGGQENLPVNCVNWYEAYAFCIWDGGFLPSAAEWEYAAAGGCQQREFPWGSTQPGTNNEFAVYGWNYDPACNQPQQGMPTCSSPMAIAPVGSATLGVGVWGQCDLAGNMAEWDLDTWAAAYVDPCTDCVYLTGTLGRVVHGGGWSDQATSLNPWSFSGSDPSGRFTIGFRCARAP
jgi:sulfatase modifying factor 1